VLPGLSIAANGIIELRCHCRDAAPREFAGVLGGERGADAWRVTRVLPLANSAAGDDAFAIGPEAFVAAERALHAAGLAWLGFVHSHPRSTAAPSARDRRELWRGCVQMIVGADGVRAFWFDRDTCRELTVRVDELAEGAR
jgi:proteasome lid subunit RPN8/RPN11